MRPPRTRPPIFPLNAPCAFFTARNVLTDYHILIPVPLAERVDLERGVKALTTEERAYRVVAANLAWRPASGEIDNLFGPASRPTLTRLSDLTKLSTLRAPIRSGFRQRAVHHWPRGVRRFLITQILLEICGGRPLEWELLSAPPRALCPELSFWALNLKLR